MSEALGILESVAEQIQETGYNCRCDEGGVDAISVDLDWLQFQLNKAIALIKGENE